MLVIFIYIAIVFFGKYYFSVSQIGLILFVLGSIWFLLMVRYLSWKKLLQPVLLMITGLLSMMFQSDLVLKSFPLMISLFFFFAFMQAHLKKQYFLVRYIKKVKTLNHADIKYLESTHLIWIVITGINVMLHSYFLFFGSLEAWTAYVSVGWYILLAAGILFQIVFRGFYEQKIFR